MAKIDKQIRGVIATLNKIPFIETIDSCQGHIYSPTKDEGYKYIHGYIVGSFYDAKKGSLFLKDLKKFVKRHNKKSVTELDIYHDSPSLFLVLNPGKENEVNYMPFKGEIVFRSNDIKVLKNREREMRDSWKSLELFLNNLKY